MDTYSEFEGVSAVQGGVKLAAILEERASVMHLEFITFLALARAVGGTVLHTHTEGFIRRQVLALACP